MKRITRFIFITIVLSVSGCAGGIMYTDHVVPADISKTAGGENATQVLARTDSWRNSGVIVKQGLQYNIAASGKWTTGATCGWTGPEGAGLYNFLCFDVAICKTIPGFSHSTLIARIGETGSPFVVGNQFKLRADRDGVLFFRINETGSQGDNKGYMTVNVAIDRSHMDTAVAVQPQSQHRPLPRQQQERPVHQDRQDSYTAVPGQNWAVIIGISTYKDTRIPSLRYAAADAKSFYTWLVSQQGGRYAPSNVKILLNQNATSRNIKRALFSWLKQPLAEDMVTIFFAGHGSPESPDDPDNLYLLPYDAQYDDIAASGFPMWPWQPFWAWRQPR